MAAGVKSWKAIRITPAVSPCMGCEEHSPKCHGSCERYEAFRMECEAIRHRRQLKRETDDAVGDAMRRMPGIREV